MGVGKDEAFKQLKLRMEDKVTRLSFADGLKDMVQKAWKIPKRDMQRKPDYVRKLLQIVGTNLFREQIDKDFWVKRILKVITDRELNERVSSHTHHIVITDVRFVNEGVLIKELGGLVIRISGVQRGKSVTGDQKHPSEMEVLKIFADTSLFNKSTKRQLGEDLENIITKWVKEKGKKK